MSDDDGADDFDEGDPQVRGGRRRRRGGERRDLQTRLDDFIESQLASFKSYGAVIAAGKQWCLDHLDGYEVSTVTVARVIANVKKRWRLAEQETVEERRAVYRAAGQELLRKAVDAEDFRAGAVIFRTLCDIEGIKAPKKVELSGTLGLRPIQAMTVQEREAEIAELLAERAASNNVLAPLPVPLQLAEAQVDPDEAFVAQLVKDADEDELQAPVIAVVDRTPRRSRKPKKGPSDN